jgi:aspartyl protease family protein
MTARLGRAGGRWLRRLLLALTVSASGPAAAQQMSVEVLGLFTNAALLEINGEQHLLRAGQSRGDVTLLSADARSAVVEVNGVQRILQLTRRIGTNYRESDGRSVTIPRNSRLQYVTNAEINGRRMQVLVDTGANVVALNSGHARQLGINLQRDGVLSSVVTAAGPVPAWRIRLDRVDVGGIVVNGVEATVIEGDDPQTVLLGTSYLRYVRMSERDGVLSLSRDY